MIISTISIVIIIIYLLLIGLLSFGFDKVEDFKLQDLPSRTRFTIVIPFRNEATNLSPLLTSIYKLNYPRSMFEIILVDDESGDNSVDLITKFIQSANDNKLNITPDIKIIKNKRISKSPKKDAITTALNVSKFSWIITTDADCILPKYWLDAFDEFIQSTSAHCVVAPVTYNGVNSFFKRFQLLDFLSLQGATIGGFGIKNPFMCNGANFAYRKSSFIAVNGFAGNNHITSGDDIFLLEKLLENDKTKVHYLKSLNAVVSTNPTQTISGLIQQRLRWAAKTSNYNSWFGKIIGLIVLLGNLICIVAIPAVLLNYVTLKIALTLFIIKLFIDFLLLFKTTRFFKQEALLPSYSLSSIIYPFFNVSIAFLSFFKSYRWKGRTSKK